MGALKAKSCSKGHRFTPENTYERPDGGRQCKKCAANRVKAYQQKKRVQKIN